MSKHLERYRKSEAARIRLIKKYHSYEKIEELLEKLEKMEKEASFEKKYDPNQFDLFKKGF